LNNKFTFVLIGLLILLISTQQGYCQTANNAYLALKKALRCLVWIADIIYSGALPPNPRSLSL